MKKTIFVLFTALTLTNCSSEKEDVIVEDKLIPSSISVTTEMGGLTRAVWGEISSDNTIAVRFEPGETFAMYEDGYEGYQLFSNADDQAYQSANFKGMWHADALDKQIAAVLPENGGSVTSISSTGTTYKINIASDQTSRISEYSDMLGVKHSTLSPASNGNVMIAAQSKHSNTCFFSPTAAYLYFYTNSNIKTVIVESLSGEGICGEAEITAGIDWDDWTEYAAKASTVRSSSAPNRVKITGCGLNRGGENITEYIVCILPGTYNQFKFYSGTTLLKASKENLNMNCKAVNLYYLGKVD